MSKIDEFESMFKSAAKPVFHIDPIRISRVSIVVDQDINDATDYVRRVESFLNVLNTAEHQIVIRHLGDNDFHNVAELIERLENDNTDLVCTYRNLRSDPGDQCYSLGQYVDVLTQATRVPVLLLPRPEELRDGTLADTDRVMLMTDHLAGDSQLITYAAMFTQEGGELILAHVEDEQHFERYMQVISKIPSIDTDSAREEISEQLLKEPLDYIHSCQAGLRAAAVPVTVTPLVTFGHHLIDYRKIVDVHNVDLLVMHTKDEDQLAMHGLAYPVTVEMRHVPLLLI